MATVTCKYTGLQFESKFRFARVHPTIKAAQQALLDRHEGVHQHLYHAAIDRALEAAAPFALSDIDRLMAEAESVGAQDEQELRAAFGETESDPMPVTPTASVYLSEWEMRGTDESGE